MRGSPKRASRRHLLGMFAIALCVGGPSQADVLGDAVAAYRSGEYRVAMPIFERLALQGNPQAQFWLGSMWYQGRGKPSSFKEAFNHFRSAAYVGNADAQNNLGLLYRNGEGVERSALVAYAWFSLASAQGNAAAKRNLDNMSDRMSADDILQSQQLAGEYLERIEASRTNRTIEPAVAMFKQPAPTTSVAAAPAMVSPQPTAPTALPLVPVRAAALPAPSAQADLMHSEQEAPRSVSVESASGSGLIEKAARPLSNVIGPEEQIALAPAATRTTIDEIFMVQLGLFRAPAGIRRIEQRLNQEGLKFTNEQIHVKGESYQRIRLGPYPTHQQARAMSARMNQMFALQSAVLPLPQ